MGGETSAKPQHDPEESTRNEDGYSAFLLDVRQSFWLSGVPVGYSM